VFLNKLTYINYLKSKKKYKNEKIKRVEEVKRRFVKNKKSNKLINLGIVFGRRLLYVRLLRQGMLNYKLVSDIRSSLFFKINKKVKIKKAAITIKKDTKSSVNPIRKNEVMDYIKKIEANHNSKTELQCKRENRKMQNKIQRRIKAINRDIALGKIPYGLESLFELVNKVCKSKQSLRSIIRRELGKLSKANGFFNLKENKTSNYIKKLIENIGLVNKNLGQYDA